MKPLNNLKWVFFGTENLSLIVLNELKQVGLLPFLIITTEDKPKGRNLVLTPPEVKVWAENNSITFLQFKTLKNPDVINEIKKKTQNADVFLVASYGKIIPREILEIPEHGTINLHPSLLPKLRGPSPIESAILTESETGVTIIKLDEEIDHGPILAQEKTTDLEIINLPYASELEESLAKKGSEMLVKVFEKIIKKELIETPQNHDLATFCQKIEKKDAEINLDDPPELNIKKIRAYQKFKPYFFDRKNHNKRVVIKKASFINGDLEIQTVLPEGGKEMLYKDYLNGIH